MHELSTDKPVLTCDIHVWAIRITNNCVSMGALNTPLAHKIIAKPLLVENVVFHFAESCVLNV